MFCMQLELINHPDSKAVCNLLNFALSFTIHVQLIKRFISDLVVYGMYRVPRSSTSVLSELDAVAPALTYHGSHATVRGAL
jgi:hypothetical protein